VQAAEDIMAELQEAFLELKGFVADYDPIALLSQLTLTFLFVPEDEFQSEMSDVVTWQRYIEFLAAFVLVRAYPSGRFALVDGAVLGRLEKLLEGYFSAVTRQLVLESAGGPGSSEESHVLAEAKIASLHVRGDAYPHQFYAFAQELYGPHDAWFREHYGFTIAEAVTLFEAIGSEYEGRCERSRERARKEAHDETARLIAEGQTIEEQRSEFQTRIACGLHFGQAEKLLGFTAAELSEFGSLPIQTCQHFLDRVSQEFGHRNPAFPDSFTDPEKAGWDYNTLHERPVVTRGGRYWVFVPPLLRSALFHAFYFDLMLDEAYRPTFEKARGRFVETKTADCLRRIFPSDMTLLNPLYPSGEEMADVIVLHDHKVLLFQCKSKALTYRARIGVDFDALRNDLRKAIGESFEQGVRARRYLQNGKGNSFLVGRARFALDMDHVNQVYLISVTSMPFQALAARLANSNSALGLFSGDEYPWALSLGDLDIITQVLRTPAQFLHYAARRRQVEGTSFSVYADEMDYLGFYLSHGMRFETDQFVGMDSVGLSGFSDDVDRWVYEKFELGHQVDPPCSPMPEGFGDFLKDVERSGDEYRTDCALTLLELGSEGRKSFVQMIADTKERSLQDKGLHSFSLVLKGGKRGISFVSFDANMDRMQVFKQTAAFAMMKKYESKCDEWTGFGWDIGSSRSVDVAFFASETWTHDAELEGLVKEKLRPGHRVEL
jgi:hypothetical protein